MSASNETRHEAEGLKYGAAENANPAEILEFGSSSLGQRNPQHCPHSGDTVATPPARPVSSPLGSPLNIAEVASLLGCSAWTVRQRYMRQGLPSLRASATGKLVFFEKQVIDWIQKRQQLKKGGNLR